MHRPVVVIMAKQPVAGRTKTRLCPPLSAKQAAGLYAAMLRDTIEWASGLADLALAILALGVLVMTGIRSGQGVWLVMYAGGFGYVASISVLQFFEHQRWLAMSPSPAASRRARTR